MEDISAEIFKNMTEFEIKRIGSAMSRLGRLEQDIVDEVMMEFYQIIQQNKSSFTVLMTSYESHRFCL